MKQALQARASEGINSIEERFQKTAALQARASEGISLTAYGADHLIRALQARASEGINIVGNNLQFTIMNTTSFSSAEYHMTPSEFNWLSGPMGNDNQTYIFSEPLRIKK